MAQDAGLAFTQNLVNRYMQFKAQQFQVELFKRREQRYERQLEENRLHRQKTLDLQERGVASLEKQRAQPKQGTLEWFKQRGYSDEEAQLGQDRWSRLAPSVASPYQQILAGKAAIGTATSWEDADAGRMMIREGVSAFREQTGLPAVPKTTPIVPPDSEEPPLFPMQGDTRGTLPINPDEGMFNRLKKPERIEVREKKTGNLFTVPSIQLEELLATGEYERVEE